MDGKKHCSIFLNNLADESVKLQSSAGENSIMSKGVQPQSPMREEKRSHSNNNQIEAISLP